MGRSGSGSPARRGPISFTQEMWRKQELVYWRAGYSRDVRNSSYRAMRSPIIPMLKCMNRCSGYWATGLNVGDGFALWDWSTIFDSYGMVAAIEAMCAIAPVGCCQRDLKCLLDYSRGSGDRLNVASESKRWRHQGANESLQRKYDARRGWRRRYCGTDLSDEPLYRQKGDWLYRPFNRSGVGRGPG